MSRPTIPIWWPPSGYDPMTESQVRELFAYLRPVIRPVMADVHRRIQDRVGADPVRVWPTTVKQLVGRRLGYFDLGNTAMKKPLT